MIEQQDISAEARAFMRSLYGENKQITDDNYDKSLAVKCINGTFVGKKKDNVIAYKGIPFVGKQPVGEQRWKAPVDFVPDEGIYEAYYYGKSPFQADGDPCSLYVMGEDCLYLNVWKARGQERPRLEPPGGPGQARPMRKSLSWYGFTVEASRQAER